MRAGRISDTAIYRLRKRSPGFARDFAALARSAPMLEQVAWERAVEGWEESVVVRGEVIGTRRRYSESLLRMLLREAQAARRIELAAEAKARQETDAQLRKLLDGLARRQHGEARLKALAEAEAWERLQAEAGGGDGDGWVRPPRD